MEASDQFVHAVHTDADDHRLLSGQHVCACPTTEADLGDGILPAVELSDAGISRDPIPAKLMYQPLEDGSVRLVWDLVINRVDNPDWWNIRVDAASGEVISRGPKPCCSKRWPSSRSGRPRAAEAWP